MMSPPGSESPVGSSSRPYGTTVASKSGPSFTTSPRRPTGTPTVNPEQIQRVRRTWSLALRDHPEVNPSGAGDTLTRHHRIHVGMAVALQDGLIVPVIRNAQDLNLTGTARAIQDIAERARTTKLLPDDVQGGTFTITNPGGVGTFHGTPIISQPRGSTNRVVM